MVSELALLHDGYTNELYQTPNITSFLPNYRDVPRDQYITTPEVLNSYCDFVTMFNNNARSVRAP